MNSKRLTKKQMWIFAIGQLGWSLLGGIISAWLVAFYLPTQDAKNAAKFSGTEIDFYTLIAPGLVIGGFLTIIGLITALCRIWDAVSDPLIANLSDNSKNPKGRRFPFMRFAAIPFSVITVLVFMAPTLFTGSTEVSGWNVAWVAIMLVLFYTFMTIYCTPYNALISEFGKTQEDRMNISTFISLTYFAGTLIAYTPFVFAGFFREAVGYYWSYIVCFIPLAIIACICMLLPTFLIKETDFVEAKPAGTNAFKSLGKTFKNKDFRVFAGSDIMYWVGLTLFQTGLPFFVKVSMKLDESMVMVFMGAMTVLSACFYPVVSNLVKKFGKKRLTIFGFIGLAIAYLITAICSLVLKDATEANSLSWVFGIAIVVISAFPMALLGIIPQSIVADIAEADSVVTGEKREGMFFAARTFAMKFGQSLAMLVFTSLAILGTKQDTTKNDITANPIGLMIVAIVAVAFCVLGAVILFFYREKKIMKTIAKEEDKAYLEAIESEKEPEDEPKLEENDEEPIIDVVVNDSVVTHVLVNNVEESKEEEKEDTPIEERKE
ncbi:MAG: MFS transporter [Acholeplasmatales bacterium]|nr:MFS transporter [Acholeplasmatales bacterium]